MKKKDINNLACPKCGKTINNKDLEHWKCVKCGADFKITFNKNARQSTNTKT